MLLHQLEDRRSSTIAVLDCFDPRQNRTPHPFLGRCMCCNLPARRVGNVDDQIHLILREPWTCLTVGAIAVVCIDLDPVGAVLHLIANNPRDRVDPVSFLRSLRNHVSVFGGEPLRPVFTGGDDRLGDDIHSRARDDPLGDRHLETNVGIPGALSSEIANRGEPGHERGLCMVDRPGNAKRLGFVKHLVIPLSFIVRMEEEVRMCLDHTGHQGRVGQLYRRRVGGRADRAARPDRGDLRATHQHSPAIVRLRGGAVPDSRRHQERGRDRRGIGAAPAATPSALSNEECRDSEQQKGESLRKTLIATMQGPRPKAQG